MARDGHAFLGRGKQRKALFFAYIARDGHAFLGRGKYTLHRTVAETMTHPLPLSAFWVNVPKYCRPIGVVFCGGVVRGPHGSHGAAQVGTGAEAFPGGRRGFDHVLAGPPKTGANI